MRFCAVLNVRRHWQHKPRPGKAAQDYFDNGFQLQTRHNYARSPRAKLAAEPMMVSHTPCRSRCRSAVAKSIELRLLQFFNAGLTCQPRIDADDHPRLAERPTRVYRRVG